ncbi:hypothetical protein NT2_05_04590 [Caenibius tardaugens NBRC 16725]|uniref:Uncharacterized protein n=1 Tax=Caenibius tardaugens NBRC 16725 TaxID=1219035 RepID=U3A455_9SPHN|nr:zinc ribbon domain-containing protein [Caenibius tardaugens]AZI36856.2 hydroxymethylglutaryl-CoA synthase family protein [Caenibius tardaugens NBRC 16725]GAD49538.1 hypothetical protein NT2_05_04590 [Caenibius tardaugens NBRC 16725]
MTGIVDWGAYIAVHRLPVALLANRKVEGGPERAIAWADEDSVTMAVDAARNCLKDRARDTIDLLIFASTTHAFAEKQGAALIATVLGLPKEVRTADIGHSLRGGAQALLLADDAVRSGRARQALVVIADSRMGASGSELERSGGDAAVAFLIGSDGVVARLTGHASHAEEIVDTWRRAGDRFTHSWEDRFTTQYGFLEPSAAVAAKLPDVADGTSRLWATSAPNRRAQGSLGKALKAEPATLAPGLFDTVGYCGAAHAPLLLAAALDNADMGQEIALIAHGDGAEALLFTVDHPRASRAVADALADRIPVASLAAYRRARKLDATEYPAADDQGISATIHFRERAEDLRLQGQRCRCGEPQFPKQRVCIRCGTKDAFAPEDFAERGASLVTYTLDAFFPSPTPPTAVGIVQVDNGPRIYMQVAGLSKEGPQPGMPLRFAFRRIHDAGQRPNYFWKALPERNAR